MQKENEKVDLHMHSSESDGLLKPEELIKVGLQYSLRAISITDHDTISGIKPAIIMAEKKSLELVPGFEISMDDNNREIHLLGYYPYYINDLAIILEKYRLARFERMEQMTNRLKRLNIKISFSEVLDAARGAAPGRLHLARLLVKKKYAESINKAFTLYLNKGTDIFVPRKLMTLKKTMSVMHDVKAIPVLAHPGFYSMDIIEKLLLNGLKGIEVFHPEHSPEDKRILRKYAQDKGLLITGGTDFHGDNISIAYPNNNTIDYIYLEQLKRYRYQ